MRHGCMGDQNGGGNLSAIRSPYCADHVTERGPSGKRYAGSSLAGIEARKATVHTRLQMPKPLSAIQSYCLAVLAVSIALAVALLLERNNFRGVEFPVFLLA